tara:strand:+ start:301 stop:489 length:189 start_codon:yes stop_codon:yes gene_type:complete
MNTELMALHKKQILNRIAGYVRRIDDLEVDTLETAKQELKMLKKSLKFIIYDFDNRGDNENA